VDGASMMDALSQHITVLYVNLRQKAIGEGVIGSTFLIGFATLMVEGNLAQQISEPIPLRLLRLSCCTRLTPSPFAGTFLGQKGRGRKGGSRSL
jgi:hypothetical protein